MIVIFLLKLSINVDDHAEIVVKSYKETAFVISKKFHFNTGF